MTSDTSPRRFERLLRGYNQSNGIGFATRADGDDLRMLAASLSDDDAFAIVGARPNGSGGSYLPSAQEWRVRAAQRLLSSGFDPRASVDGPQRRTVGLDAPQGGPPFGRLMSERGDAGSVRGGA